MATAARTSLDVLLAGEVPAAAWCAPASIPEQLGCRKVVDTTFMAGFMLGADTDADDVRKYFSALKCAQMDLDLEPERQGVLRAGNPGPLRRTRGCAPVRAGRAGRLPSVQQRHVSAIAAVDAGAWPVRSAGTRVLLRVSRAGLTRAGSLRAE
jgi:hypothetical protein